MTLARLRCAGLAAAVLATAAGPAAIGDAGVGYRGQDASGVYPARGLLRSWPTEGPKLLWQTPLGITTAPVTVHEGKVYVVAGGDAWLHVFDLDGNRLGKAHLGSAAWKRFGFSRSTPLVAEGVAVGTTPNANLYGVDLENMTTRWKVNAWTDFGTGSGSQGWGLPESPILHREKVIFNPVSRDDQTPPLVAVDIRDGERIVWEADPGRGKHYSAADVSAASFRHRGRNLILSPTWCYLLCLDADTGKTLWEIPSCGEKTLTPVYSDGLVLTSIRRETGSEADRKWPAWASMPLDPPYRPVEAPTQPAPVTLRERMRKVRWGREETVMLRLSDDARTAEVLWVRREAPGRYSHAVLLDGRVYCFGNTKRSVQRSEDGALPPLTGRAKRSRGSDLLCLDAETGEVIAQAPAGVPGHVVSVDGMIYAVDLVRIRDPHDASARPKRAPRVRLLQPTDEGFSVTGEIQPFTYRTAPELRDGEWEASVPPTIARGRLFLKYGPLMVFDLRSGEYRRTEAPKRPEAPPLSPKVAFPTTRPARLTARDVPALLDQLGSRLAAHRKTTVSLLKRPEVADADGLAEKLADRVTSGGPEAWLTQAAAAEVLQARGPKARAALPTLLEALPDVLARRDGTLGRLILLTVQAIDPSATAKAAGPTAELLGDDDPHVQYLAAGLLKRMGPRAQDGAERLAGRLLSPNLRVCHEASAALAAIGPAGKAALPRMRTALLEALKSTRAPHCRLVMAAFDGVGLDGVRPIVPRIARMLQDGNADRRALAARTLARAGEAGADAIPSLVAALASEEQKVLATASEALLAMDNQTGEAAKALAKVLADGEQSARLTAANLLMRMGVSAAPATAALAEALESDEPKLQRAATRALGAIGPGAVKAVGPLARTLKSENRDLARAAAEALGKIGSNAEPAPEALLGALKHGDLQVGSNAAEALAKIGVSPVEPLVNILRTGSARRRQWAAETLGRFPDGAARSIPALVEAMDAEDERLVGRALSAIRSLGPKAAPAVEALLKLAKTSEPRRASHALQAIGRIGPAAKAAVPELIKMIEKAESPLVYPVVHALRDIGEAAEAAVGPLVALSRRSDRRLAKTIRRALDRIKTENVPPKAADAEAVCPEGRSVLIDLPTTDADDVTPSLRVHIAEGPKGGSLDRARGARIRYHSRPGFVGEDGFSYNVSDRRRASSETAKVTVTVTPDTRKPSVEKARLPLGRDNVVFVAFDEPVTRETAEAAGNYTLNRDARVLKAMLQEDGRTVTLKTTALDPGAAYTLEAKGIRDRSKAGNTGGGKAGRTYRPLAAGLKRRVFTGAVELSRRSRDPLSDFEAAKAEQVAADESDRIRLPEESPKAPFTMRFDGVIELPRRSDGGAFARYAFSTVSTGRSYIVIDGRMVLSNRGGGRNGRKEERSTTLAAGLHRITVIYVHRGGTPTLEARWSGPSIPQQEIPAEVLTHRSGS